MSDREPAPGACPARQRASPRKAARPWRRRLVIVLLILGALCIESATAGYWHNNCPHMSEAQFAAALAQAVDRGRRWVVDHTGRLWGSRANASMFYLIQDMHRLSPNPRFAELVDDFQRTPAYPAFSKRLLDPDHDVSAREMNRTLGELHLDYRWLVYALEPQAVELSPEDERLLFDAESCHGLLLAHKLWALLHMRRLSADPRVTDELVGRTCQRIADEHARSIFVDKLHCERVGFILMAGQPEKINRRWVERIIENQREDGGWNDRLYAFGVPLPWRNTLSDEHSTLVALWTLHQVEFACP